MQHSRTRPAVATAFLFATVTLIATAAGAQAPSTVNPLIRENATQRVSEHVFVILDDNVSFVPNVGIVVGERATLVVDTGLGERNGRIVLQEARKLSDNQEFYIAATHFHPEHDLGATAFPPNAKMVRWRQQQIEADELGAETNRRFAGFGPALAELLEGASFRPADVLFEDAVTLDLGGVHVRVEGVGPTHTRGDTVFYVNEDRVLLTGDVVMSLLPAPNAQSGSLQQWLANLNAFEAFNPVQIVPAHGRLGDGALIRRYREYLSAVQSRVVAAKREGLSVEDTVSRLSDGLANEFVDLQPVSGPAPGRINQAIQAAYREAR